ncbi:MAG TPA: guanylate kinase [Terriglobia bacterium]|nr:guanylate kinase [Terriglobia bacterium]
MAKSKLQAAGRGTIIVISAPSGAGKSTLTGRLLESLPGLVFSVSHTTRPPRPGEKDGWEYFFVSEARFKRMIAAREFVEWAKVYGNYYGTSLQQLRSAQRGGKDILLDIDVQGHSQVRRKLPEAVSVFLMPPSFQELKRRLRRRHSDAPDVISRRLAQASLEVHRWKEYDYVVVNREIESAAASLKTIVTAARYRREAQRPEILKICKTFGG